MHVYLLVALAVLIGSGLSGCTGFQSFLARPEYKQAEGLRAAGNYRAAVQQYREAALMFPDTADEALFSVGCIYANPKNPERDYQKSLEAFRRLVSEHPGSRYREPSEIMISLVTLIGEMSNREKSTPALRRQIDSLEKQVDGLQKQIEQMKAIDRSLEERRRAVQPRK
jgi:tetratricopeptide (TPR) repeat protein